MARFVTITCCYCHEEFGIEPTSYTALKRSAQTFYCTWGHGNHFPNGPTETDQLRQERDRLKQQMARVEEEKRMGWVTASAELSRRQMAERQASAYKGQVTRLKKRAANGVCPCCNRTFENLARHMKTKHAGFVAEEVAPEGATLQ